MKKAKVLTKAEVLEEFNGPGSTCGENVEMTSRIGILQWSLKSGGHEDVSPIENFGSKGMISGLRMEM